MNKISNFKKFLKIVDAQGSGLKKARLIKKQHLVKGCKRVERGKGNEVKVFNCAREIA